MISCSQSLRRMECLVELEIVGKRMMVYGDGREIIRIKVEEEKIRMRIAGFYDMLSMLREELKIGVKVIETMTGLQSKHEILVNGLEIEEKIRGEDDYEILKQKQVQGIGENQMLSLYAIKEKEWRVGLEVQGKRGKLDIQQGLLVEMYVNARKIAETIEDYYDRRNQNKKRKRDKTQEMQKAEVMISWSKFIKEKIQEKSSEYCLGCKDGIVSHRDDCYRGNHLKFVLHHFPISIGEVISIRKFWRARESHVETNPHEEELLKELEDFLNNKVDKDHTVCRKILNNILASP